MYQIIFYETDKGKRPVANFLDSLDHPLRAKALRSLSLLEEYGISMREPFSKSIGGGLFELRIQFSNDISRIFYFFYSNKKSFSQMVL